MPMGRDIPSEVELQMRHHPTLRSREIEVGAITLPAPVVRTCPERFEAGRKAKRVVDIPGKR